MGALASLALAKGYTVSGSDVKEGAMVQRLRQEGAEIYIGHDANHLREVDVVVYSSAIAKDNPEMVAAGNQKVKLLKRAEFLAQLMQGSIEIAVAGAHGKTTTSSMIALLLIQAGLNPTTAVGGIIDGSLHNAALGQGEYFVAEVDESDGSFLYFSPRYAVITNIDFEHVDYYKSWENILDAYQQFISQVDPEGCLVVCGEDERLRLLLKDCQTECLTYGMSEECDVFAKNVRARDGREYAQVFSCFLKGEFLGEICLSVPGRHNVLNALACVALSQKLSIDFSVVQETLRCYQGVNRRFQIVGDFLDVTVVDDYAHHPTEIAATIQTAKDVAKARLVTIFQPHRYSRTKFLMDGFVESLSRAEQLILTDIYAASEEPIDGVSSEILYERLRCEKGEDVMYLKKDEIVPHLLDYVEPEDMVLFLGAGDISRVAKEFAQALKVKEVSRN